MTKEELKTQIDELTAYDEEIQDIAKVMVNKGFSPKETFDIIDKIYTNSYHMAR